MAKLIIAEASDDFGETWRPMTDDEIAEAERQLEQDKADEANPEWLGGDQRLDDVKSGEDDAE